MKQVKQHWQWLVMGSLAWGSLSGWACSTTAPSPVNTIAPVDDSKVTVATSETKPAQPNTEQSALTQAFEAATTAAQLAQSATTANEWSAVATAWSEAIQALQAVSPDSPEWLFAQRKTREYFENQAIALQQVEAAAKVAIFPPLGNAVLDEQLALYMSYVAAFGTPDVMIVGSSRALQGLNPQILQQRFSQQGYSNLKVYNFAVNGATAQVVSFVLRQLLTPDQMPEMIIWAGGSRSFNSGRFDRTFAKILESPGYAAVQAGDRPSFENLLPLAATPNNLENDAATDADKARVMPISNIDSYGFLAVNDVFEPSNYYQSFPRVTGTYDDAYSAFSLEGVQAVSFDAIVGFAQSRNIPLIFVNLPLSDDYLDETRLFYEQQFQQFLAREAQARGFYVIDLLREWPNQNIFFADPSHLNRVGAAQVAIRVAEDNTLPWQELFDNIAEPTAEETADPTEGAPSSTDERRPNSPSSSK